MLGLVAAGWAWTFKPRRVGWLTTVLVEAPLGSPVAVGLSAMEESVEITAQPYWRRWWQRRLSRVASPRER